MHAFEHDDEDGRDELAKLALYITGLLPLCNEDDSRAVLKLSDKLLPILAASVRETAQRREPEA